MKSRLVRSSMLIASIMGLLVTTTPPAEAIWVKNVTLNGIAGASFCRDVNGNSSWGLGNPTWTNGPTTTVETPHTSTTTKVGPKGEPEVNTTVHNGNTCDFFFSADCIKGSVGKKVGFDTCAIFAVGTVTGFCDLTSGTGTVVLINTSNTVLPKPDVVTDFKFSWTNSTLRLSGGDGMQNIHGVAAVTPGLAAGGNCTTKTATSFIIQGDVVIKKIT